MKNFLFPIILIFLFMMMMVGQSLYQYHESENKTVDIYNYTESLIAWNSTMKQRVTSSYEGNTSLNMSSMSNYLTNNNLVRFENIIEKSIDWVGFCSFEYAKWGIEFGYTHPQYNYNYMIKLIKIWFYAVIILMMIPAIVPICALAYLSYTGIRKLVKFILDFKKRRKKNEKRENNTR